MIETILVAAAFIFVGYLAGYAFPISWVMSKLGKGGK